LAEFLRHGGRLAAARAAFPNASEPWIDLSTGINPHSYPARRASPAALRRLPDPAETAALEAAAAQAFGVPAECVAATPGTEAALRALPRVLGARSVAIATPTYGGHAEAWRLAGAKVACVPRERLAAAATEALVLVNPNNPDGAVGAIPDPDGRWLIVDEAFVETAPERSMTRSNPPPLGEVARRAGAETEGACGDRGPPQPASLPAPPTGEHLDGRGRKTIVLRSFGKFYGLPGVRLGLVIAEPGLAGRIGAQFGDWPVSAEAIAAGRAAYADSGWAERMRLRLAGDARRLDALLEQAGLNLLGGTSLFRLVEAPDAQQRFLALARLGVLVRPFSDPPTWLRFGIPKPKDWPRLAAALEATRP
jgi:cobalamin biosynthetic protein CobC